MSETTKNIAVRTFEWAIESALDGVPGLASASELAKEFSPGEDYKDVNEAVNALIRWQAAKNGGLGVLTGVLGVINVPAAVGALATSFGASWLIQARLAGAIAILYGHDLQSDRVRTAVMWVVLGDTASASLSTAGKAVAEAAMKKSISGISGKSLTAINQAIGKRVITKFGSKGIVNLGRLIPILGGVIGGTMDGGGCFLVGKAAKKVFKREV